jgi:hypothetical protein
MDALEITYIVDGIEKTEGFDGYDYWMEKIDGEERFKKRIKENINRIDVPEEKAYVKEIKKYKDVKI